MSESWTTPFVRLLNGENEEIILREAAQLNLIASAIEEATALGASGEDLGKLTLLNKTLESKISLPGTKAQLKPGFTKGKLPPGTIRKLEKLQLVFKWGGEVNPFVDYDGIEFNFVFFVVHTCCEVSVARSRREYEEGSLDHE